MNVKNQTDDRMILFYSEFCPHCSMLLETIKRHDEDKTIRLLSIEVLKISNKLPPTIHSVPALMTLPEKKLMFGKAVFDYLLLPGSGKLLTGSKPVEQPVMLNQGNNGNNGSPAAFTLGASLSDSFSPFASGDNAHQDYSNTQLDDRVYNWASVTESTTHNTNMRPPLHEDTRSKKDLPDIDLIRQQRDVELRGEVNVTSMPNPVQTRTSI